MSGPAIADLLSQTEAIYEKYPDHWRNEEAKAELRAIWGDAVNAHGVFVGAPDEVLYNQNGYRAEISVGTARGVFAFGCSVQTPTSGHSFASSISGKLHGSHDAARTAAIEYLLKAIPTPMYPHEESQRQHLDRMRQAVGDLLRQPSLF